jgi:glutathione S-transferase
VITDGDNTIAESGAVIEYLLQQYGGGRLIPAADSKDRLRYTYWLHYAEGSAMPPLLMKLIFGRLARPPMPAILRPLARAIANGVLRNYIDPQLKTHLDFMEGELGKSTWFAGEEFSAADIQMSFPLEAAQSRGGLDASRPRLFGFLQRIHARPAYQRAIEKGGKYDLLK